MPLQLVSPPTEEPVTLEDLAQHVRQDNVDDDDYLEALIPAARELIEQSTGRAFIDQTWKLTLRDFPISGLPRHPDSNTRRKNNFRGGTGANVIKKCKGGCRQPGIDESGR